MRPATRIRRTPRSPSTIRTRRTTRGMSGSTSCPPALTGVSYDTSVTDVAITLPSHEARRRPRSAPASPGSDPGRAVGGVRRREERGGVEHRAAGNATVNVNDGEDRADGPGDRAAAGRPRPQFAHDPRHLGADDLHVVAGRRQPRRRRRRRSRRAGQCGDPPDRPHADGRDWPPARLGDDRQRGAIDAHHQPLQHDHGQPRLPGLHHVEHLRWGNRPGQPGPRLLPLRQRGRARADESRHRPLPGPSWAS